MEYRPKAQSYNFLLGGEMGALMRAKDWSKTPLGPIEDWPQSLRTSVDIVLSSRYAMFVWWGQQLTNLYNDAYQPILGKRHPHALGQSARDIWAEIWHLIGPRAEAVLQRAESTFDEALLLIMERFGYPEETYFTFSYSPIRNDQGEVGGLFCAVTEETRRVIGERRLRLLREIGETSSKTHTPEQVCEAAAACISGNARDLPFALLYLTDEDGKTARLVAQAGIDPGSPGADLAIDLDDQAPLWPLAEAARDGKFTVLDHLAARFGRLPSGDWDRPPERAVIVPLSEQGQSGVAGFLIAGLNPYLLFENDYWGFIDLLSSQITAGIANARAYQKERQRAESLAEIDRAKTLFFSNVSHEFRTPLTLMLAPIEEMLSEAASAADQGARQRLELVHRNALRLLKLVNALLDFSRIEAGRVRARYQRTDIAGYTADLASNFRSATDSAGLKLVVDCTPIKAPVFIDRDLWETIVLNLVSNAFKFTFEGRIAVSIAERDGFAELCVADTGIGIPSEQLPLLFERFHRVEGARGRTFEGTGIGLALVQELIKLHGGSISVESVPGAGTTFHVRIPLGKDHLPPEHVVAEAAPSAIGTRAQAYVDEALRWLPESAESDQMVSPALGGSDELVADARAAGTGRRIVLADDNADMRAYVQRLLVGQGYEVEATADGEAALAATLQRIPDLVLTDAMMPKLDGFGLLEALRAEPRTKDVPVIMLSARAGEEAKVEGLKAGADDYLVKPFAARELFARIASAIALRNVRREAAQALRDESARIRRLFEQAPGFIAILEGPEHRFEFANDAYSRLVGKRELIGRTIRETFPEIEGQGFLELLDRVYQKAERFVGEQIPLRLAQDPESPPREFFLDFIYEPIVAADGRVTGVFVEGYDVTARVSAQRQLRESEARFRTLAENIPTLCWMARPDGHIFWYNSRWHEYTGTSREDQEGWGWESVHDPTVLPQVRERWKHSIATGEPFEMVFPLKRYDGEFRPFLTRIVPTRDADGNIVRWFGSNTDITSQRKYEEHLRLLINELNHRVKNTLAVVLSMASQTFKDGTDIRLARKAFEARLFALSAAHTLLTDESWTGADIRLLLTETLAPFVGKAAERIRFQGPEIWLTPKMVLGLSMAMHELATNATKYGALANKIGRIDISWSVDESPQGAHVTITWLESGGPAVKVPAKRGFGSRLIERGLASDLGGKVHLKFAPGGLVCTMRLPLQKARDLLSTVNTKRRADPIPQAMAARQTSVNYGR